MLNSPLLHSYTEDVKQQARSEMSKEQDFKLALIPWAYRIICLLLAVGLFWKPLAAVFFIYPVAELILDKIAPYFTIRNVTSVSNKLEVHDISDRPDEESPTQSTSY